MKQQANIFNEALSTQKRQKDPKWVLSRCLFYFAGDLRYKLKQSAMSSIFLELACAFSKLHDYFSYFSSRGHR